MELFERIDRALGIYYANCGRNDYYDENDDGKFLLFVIDGEFDEQDIDLELGDDVKPTECLFTNMDDNFPLIDTNKDGKNYSRDYKVFKVIKYCYKHGVPPKQATQIPININIDFTIFTDSPTDCSNIASCTAKVRIVNAMKYYQSLNIRHKNGQLKLVQFYKETYKGLLLDFIHIIQEHHAQMDDIYDFIMDNKSILNKCNVIDCVLSARHNRNRAKNENCTVQFAEDDYKQICQSSEVEIKKNDSYPIPIPIPIPITIIQSNTTDVELDADEEEEEDNLAEEEEGSDDDWLTFEEQVEPVEVVQLEESNIYDVDGRGDFEVEFTFIRDLFDGIHCYMLHQYDFGYRIYRKEEVAEKYGDDDEDDEDVEHMTYKDNAFALLSKIINKKKVLLNKIPRFATNTKFNIDMAKAENYTFIDGLYQQMKSSTSLAEAVEIMRCFEKHEYDSDAIQADIMHSGTQSNIVRFFSAVKYEMMKKYFVTLKVHAHLFSTGFRFYYWEHYRTKHIKNEVDNDVHNLNDHGGYDMHQLFVEAKFINIKAEILHNSIHPLNINQFKLSLVKANEYIDTPRARKLKAKTSSSLYTPLHYNIKNGREVRVSNLLSIILYTDWTELCTAFSKTFRKIHIYEPIALIINRHRQFANWSRLLRETVELFGDYAVQKKYAATQQESFYCGMSFAMVMPEFNIRLSGPTSTTRQIEIAYRFAGEEGIVIELSMRGMPRYNYLKTFSCSWLSTFGGEGEYLFIGGEFTLRIESIREVISKNNYHAIFKSLFYFDCVLNGADLSLKTASNRDCSIINSLIRHHLKDDGFENTYTKYINDTFGAFVYNKRQIVLHLVNLRDNKGLNKMAKLILDILDLEELYDGAHDVYDGAVPKQTLFQLFPNVDRIIIHTGRSGRVHYVAVDLSKLLAVISSSSSFITNDLTIAIGAPLIAENKPELSSSVEVSYAAKKWRIVAPKLKFVGKPNCHYPGYHDCLVITKM